MITIAQILRYKEEHKISKISFCRNNMVKLYYNDCTSCYITIYKFITWVQLNA